MRLNKDCLNQHLLGPSADPVLYSHLPAGSGPRRSRRPRRSLASKPYDRQPAPNEAGGQVILPIPAARAPCPRLGIAWIASRYQPQAAWQSMNKPHEVARTTVANFFFTLTAHNVRDDAILSAISEYCSDDQDKLNGNQDLCQLARACKELDGRKKSFDFQYMLSLIRLSFKCARYVQHFFHL